MENDEYGKLIDFPGRKTDDVIKYIDDDVIDLQKTKDKLRTALCELFPERDAAKLFSGISKGLRPKEVIMNFDLNNPGDIYGPDGSNKKAAGDKEVVKEDKVL